MSYFFALSNELAFLKRIYQIMEQKIIAVVVTFNRLTLLKRAIEFIQKQTLSVCEIIIVNNGSTDGTTEWLTSQESLTVVNQDNVGGAGGFYTGIKVAYEHNADWIWCMDDDVYPSEKCLETLYSYSQRYSNIGIICPRRIQAGEVVYGETLKFNLSNPFRPLNRFLKSKDIGKHELVKIEGMAFEGPLVSRAVVDAIGFPNQDLFIFFDDSDYSYRATLAGFDVMYCKNAILNKELFPKKILKSGEYRNNWKLFYDIRNSTFFCCKYGKNSIFRFWGEYWRLSKIFLAMGLSFLLMRKKYQTCEFHKAVLAIKQGRKCQLGKI